MASFATAIGLTTKRIATLCLLVGFYCVVRFAASSGSWPNASTFGVSAWPAILGLICLLGCSICSHVALRSPENHRRRWLIVFALGVIFLCIRVVEYSTVASKSAIPGIGSLRSVYDQADLDWLSSVKTAIDAKISTINSREQNSDSLEMHESYLAIKEGFVDWTQRRVGMSDDRADQEKALDLLAWQIDPAGFSREESERISKLELKYNQDYKEAFARCQAQLQKENTLLSNLQSKLGAAKTTESPVQRVKLINEARETTARIGDLTSQLTKMQKRIVAVHRIRSREFNRASTNSGINPMFNLRLPKVVPYGNRWAFCYWLWTLIHTGFVLKAIWNTNDVVYRGDLATLARERVENVAHQWHFVDFFAILLFSLLYLF